MQEPGADLLVETPPTRAVIGAMVTSTIHMLIITPVIFYIVKLRALRRGVLRPSRMAL
jgi:Cu(I)/Ag(I) efflux system membrane protein CusA/SilA